MGSAACGGSEPTAAADMRPWLQQKLAHRRWRCSGSACSPPASLRPAGAGDGHRGPQGVSGRKRRRGGQAASGRRAAVCTHAQALDGDAGRGGGAHGVTAYEKGREWLLFVCVLQILEQGDGSEHLSGGGGGGGIERRRGARLSPSATAALPTTPGGPQHVWQRPGRASSTQCGRQEANARFRDPRTCSPANPGAGGSAPALAMSARMQ